MNLTGSCLLLLGARWLIRENKFNSQEEGIAQMLRKKMVKILEKFEMGLAEWSDELSLWLGMFNFCFLNSRFPDPASLQIYDYIRTNLRYDVNLINVKSREFFSTLLNQFRKRNWNKPNTNIPRFRITKSEMYQRRRKRNHSSLPLDKKDRSIKIIRRNSSPVR